MGKSIKKRVVNRLLDIKDEPDGNRKEAEQEGITIHWWNMGKKTLDFEGTYKNYLLQRNIKVSIIKNRYSGSKGYRFKIPLSSCVATLDIFDFNDYARCCDEAIRIFLTLLGDKTLFSGRYGRKYHINWR